MTIKFDPKKRALFTRTTKRLAELVITEVENKVQQSRTSIRPPFALNEFEFLLHCTRCGACVDACPNEVIHLYDNSESIALQQTPYLDLDQNACLLCHDWPCAVACPTLAISNTDTLIIDTSTLRVFPKLAHIQLDTQRCLPYLGPECGACRGSCPLPDALVFDTMEKPHINTEQCTGCGQCVHACITDPSAISINEFPFDPNHRN